MSNRGFIARARASVAFISIVSLVAGNFAALPAQIVSAATTIANPSFESGNAYNQSNPVDGSGGPTGWSADWYATTTNPVQYTFTYPVTGTGEAGTKAAKITATGYNTAVGQSAAEWSFTPIEVTPGVLYSFSDKYMASTTTEVDVQYKVANGAGNVNINSSNCDIPDGTDGAGAGFTYCYDVLASSIPAASTWTTFSSTFIPPEGTASAVVLHLLDSNGSLTVDDFSLSSETPNPNAFPQGMVTLTFDDGWKTAFNNESILKTAGLKATYYIITGPNGSDIQAPGTGNPANTDYMSLANITTLQTDGMDIGAHTRNHTDLTATTTAGDDSEIAGSRTDLTTHGLTPVDTFAYPLGAYNATVEARVQAAGFTGARTTDDGFNDKSVNPFELKMQEIHTTTSIGQVESWINTATSSKTWLVLLMHKVQTGCTTDTECITPTDLQTIINYLTAHGVKVVTMHEGVQALSAPADTTAPNIAITAPANGSTITTATTTISGTTDDNTSPIVLALNGKTYNVTPGGGVWALTIPDTDALANGTYTIFATSTDSSSNKGTTSSTFTVALTPVNAAPIAQSQSATTSKNTPIDLTLSATDADSPSFTFATTSSPAHGTLSGTFPTLTYTPATDYIGTDSFTFTANDGTSTSNTATVSIVVTDVPAPVITGESNTVTTQDSVTIAWTTDHPSTSRVVWDTVSHSDASTTEASTTPNYSYANSTTEDSTLVTSHSVTISGLSNSTTYYFRPISHGSPATIGSEVVVTTSAPNTTTGGGGTPAPTTSGGGDGGGGGIVGWGPLSIGYVNTNTGSAGTGGGVVLGTSTVNCYIFTIALGVGSTGADVTALQNTLTALGFYSGPVTGYYGSLTMAGVERFQAAHGLPQVGVVGPLTRAALNSCTPSATGTTTSGQDGIVKGDSTYLFSLIIALGAKNNDVTELQKRLTIEGFFTGPITGYFGPLTLAAVKAYQTAHGIPSTGLVGPLTIASLNGGSK